MGLDRAGSCSALAIALAALLLGSVAQGDPPEQQAEAALARGDEAFASGQLELAMQSFSAAAEQYAARGEPGPRCDALVRLASARQAAGHFGSAAAALDEALPLAEGLGDARRTAAVLGGLGDLQLAIGSPQPAEELLQRAVELARQVDDPALLADLLNNLGNARVFRGDFAGAAQAYEESTALARAAGQSEAAARSLANAARAAEASGDPDAARSLVSEAAVLSRSLPATSAKAELLINLGQTTLRLGGPGRAKAAHALLDEARQVAEELDEPRLASFALGYLGELYLAEGRSDDALGLARRAAFQAQRAGARESLWRWHRLAGRALAQRGDRAQAVEEYEQAVELLQVVRHEQVQGYGASLRSFRQTTGPVYFELVDVLLRSAADTQDPAEKRRLLLQARDTVESLKAAELRDYFEDDCVDSLQAQLQDVERASAAALVVYPILLPDRIELLVSLPDGDIRRYATPVGVEAVTQEVRRLRSLLEKRVTREYLPHAQRLHEWLVVPWLDVAQAGAETIVFVPDGPLRTIPLAALHDGERFLGERFAVAITPGIELTDPRPLSSDQLEVLVLGLSESVQGYPPLSHVVAEVEAVKAAQGGDVLLNSDFELGVMEERLVEGNYGVVHIATHGEFGGRHDDSFLLAYDGRLTMDLLEDYVGRLRYREQPIEMLMLSACDTAAGDDRSALGLSGIAIKAGARSAVGSLWPVNDAASALLVAAFYEQLSQPDVSRAEAMRRAQAQLRGDLRYWHPGYWAPFQLISNWL